VGGEGNFFSGRHCCWRGWGRDRRHCYRRLFRRWWRWRQDALAILQFFRRGADWQVATGHGISRGPVAGAPAQAEWVAGNDAARVLYVGAVWRAGLDVLGYWREWRSSRL